jgi:glycosyltransferase involved in cell wall biosynthesis
MTKVSVIIPSYNHCKFLKQRIDSVLEQSFDDFEVVLLDDASTDDSITILKSYEAHPKVTHIIINENNSGSPFGMWKQGFNLAKGEYVWIAETDDFAEPDFLKHTVQVLNSNENTTLAYTDSRIINEESEELGFWSKQKNTFFKTNRWSKNHSNSGIDEIVDYLLFKVTINNVSAVLFRKKQLLEIDLNYLMQFKNVGDLYTYCEVLFKGDISYVASPLNNYRTHEMNVTKTNTKSGVFFIDALKCYTHIINSTIEHSNYHIEKERLKKATKFIINRFGFHLVKHGYLSDLEDFILNLKKHNIFSKSKTTKLLYAFKVYRMDTKKIKYIAKKIIKESLS